MTFIFSCLFQFHVLCLVSILLCTYKFHSLFTRNLGVIGRLYPVTVTLPSLLFFIDLRGNHAELRQSLNIALDFYIWEGVRLALKGFLKLHCKY